MCQETEIPNPSWLSCLCDKDLELLQHKIDICMLKSYQNMYYPSIKIPCKLYLQTVCLFYAGFTGSSFYQYFNRNMSWLNTFKAQDNH